jgi:hypothetical protein
VVVDTEGRGVEGASVYLEVDPVQPRDRTAAATDAAGSFEIRRMPAGRVLVRVEHPAFAPAVVENVAVGAQAGRQPLRITLPRGARIEGVVRHRDGRPFRSGRVVVQGLGTAAAYAPPVPLTPDENGAFTLDHMLPGRARIFALAFTPGRGPRQAASLPTLSPIGTTSVDLRDGQSTAVQLELRDVAVHGRVTRGGRGVGGVRVALSGPRESVSFPGMAVDPTPDDPPMLAATTREDGTYELLAFTPGPTRVSVSDAASGGGLATRPVAIADADRFAFDLELSEARLTGVVVRQEDGTPLPDVLLMLTSKSGAEGPPLRGRSSAEGRFGMGAEPGEYLLRAEVLGRVPATRMVELSVDGATDLRLEMSRGESISGRLLDGNGRPVGEREVFAFGADGFERSVTRRDGSFGIEGLGAGPYALSAGSAYAGFAIRPAIRPGPEPVVLQLQAGARLSLRVLTADGQPVPEAVASVVSVDSHRVDPSLCAAPPADDQGRITLGVPAGEISLLVVSEVGGAARTIKTRPNETTVLEVRLDPPGR